MVLLSAVCFSSKAVIVKLSYQYHVNTVSLLTLRMAFSVLVFLLTGFFIDYSFLMAIIATVAPAYLLSEGIRLVGAGNAAIIASIGPISTIMLAYIFLGERVSFIQLAGTAVVLAGILLITLRKG